MHCRKANRYIHLALDDELSPGRTRALQDHLRACEPCNRLHGQLAALHAATERLAFRSAAIRAVPPSLDITYRRPRAWMAIGAVAAVMALAVTAWRLGTPFSLVSNTQPVEIYPGSTPLTTQPTLLAAAPAVRIELATDSDTITVKRPTHRSNITIMWVYPTLKTISASSDSNDPLESPSQGAQS
jgi:hypothetical protein